jgi:hypothetical protein
MLLAEKIAQSLAEMVVARKFHLVMSHMFVQQFRAVVVGKWMENSALFSLLVVEFGRGDLLVRVVQLAAPVLVGKLAEQAVSLPDPVAGMELGNLMTLIDQQPELVVGWQVGEWLELVIAAGFGRWAGQILAMLAD